MKRLFPIITVLALVLLPAWARAADNWKASVSVSEEYNDNVKEERHGEGDYVTSVSPSLGFKSEGSRFLFETDNSLTFRNYATGAKDDEFINNLNARGVLTAVENFLFVEVSDQYRTTYLDTSRSSLNPYEPSTLDPVTGQPIPGALNPNDTSTGLVNQNTFNFSPYTVVRLGDRGSAKTGYRYQEITYDRVGIDKTIQTGFSDATYSLTDKWDALGGVSYVRQDSVGGGLARETVYAGASYQYAEGSSIYAKAGPTFTQYDRGGEDSNPFWDAGITHSFGSVVASLSTSVSYDEDPLTNETLRRELYSARVSKQFERTRASVYVNYATYDGQSSGTSDRYTVGFNVQHDLTQRLSGNFDVSRDVTERGGGDTGRWYTGVGLKYQLAENYTGEVWYRYKDSYSKDVSTDTFTVNRIGVQLTASF